MRQLLKEVKCHLNSLQGPCDVNLMSAHCVRKSGTGKQEWQRVNECTHWRHPVVPESTSRVAYGQETKKKALTVLPACHMVSTSFTAMYIVPENDMNQRAEKRNKESEMESDKREGEVRTGVLSMFYIECDCRECGKRISPGLFKDNRTILNPPRFFFTHTFSLTHRFTPTLFSSSLIDQSVLLLLGRPGCSLSCEAV